MGQSNRWVFTTATVIAAACGAKTDLGSFAPDDREADAGATGGRGGAIGAAGRGGVGGRGGAGTGGGGRGESLGRGGTFGAAGNSSVGGAAGMAGGGGMAGAAGRGGGGIAGIAGRGGVGGSANVGGSNIGGTGNVGGTTVFDVSGMAAAVCARIEPPPCADSACFGASGPCTLDECLTRVTENYQLAILEGCGREYFDIADCILRTPDVCQVLQCLSSPLGQNFNRCYQYNDCIAATPVAGSCAVNCSTPDWGAECEQGPGGLVCTCSRGPRAGLRFMTGVGCNSAEWNPTMQAFCR